MYYLLLLCIFLILLIITIFAIVFRKRLSKSMRLGICIVTLILTVVGPFLYVMTHNFFKENITITALDESNEDALSTDIALVSIEANYWSKGLDNPAEGKWVWLDGTYYWSIDTQGDMENQTSSIVMEVPVGYIRNLTFKTGPNYGKAEVTYGDSSTTYDFYTEAEDIQAVTIADSPRALSIKDKMLRVGIVGGCEIVLLILITICAVLINKKTNWRVIQNWKYEFFVFALCLMNIIRWGAYPTTMAYPNTFYMMSYEGGFASRRLIGELSTFLFGPYIDSKILVNVKFSLLIVFYLSLSILIVRIAKKQKDKMVGLFFVLLFLSLPMTFIQIRDDVRPDFYMIVLFLLAIILININKFIQLIPLICVLLMLMNETSCTYFIAPILTLIIYHFFKQKDFRYAISLISSFGFTCFLAIYFLFVGKGNALTPNQLLDHMYTHTNSNFHYTAIAAENMSFEDHIIDNALSLGNQSYPGFEHLKQIIVYFILIIPAVILFVILWKAVYRKIIVKYLDTVRKKRIFKFVFSILVLSTLTGSACMLLGYDYVRFTSFMMIGSMTIIFSLLHIEKVDLNISDLYLFTPSKSKIPVMPFLILLYFIFWGVADVWVRDTPLISRIVTVLENIG